MRTDRNALGWYRLPLAAAALAALWIGDLRSQPAADLLLVGGLVHDGSGQPPARQDVGVAGERISFVGDAAAAGLETVHVLVNGRFAIRDGDATGALAGRPIRRPTPTGEIARPVTSRAAGSRHAASRLAGAGAPSADPDRRQSRTAASGGPCGASLAAQ